jgi:hypothetical protein
LRESVEHESSVTRAGSPFVGTSDVLNSALCASQLIRQEPGTVKSIETFV